MAVTDFFAGEIATELLKMLITISRKSCLCKTTADNLRLTIESILPIIQEIKYTGVELPAMRQRQLDDLSNTLRDGLILARKVDTSGRWNVYKNLQLSRKMEKLEKSISRFMIGPLQAHVLADVHHARFESAERFDRIDGSTRRLEQRLGSMKIRVEEGEWLEAAMKRVEEEEEKFEDCLVNLGVCMELAKMKVKEMLIGREDLGIVGICGIGGSGKTTLAREICRDAQIQSYFNNRVFSLTVSQSPNVQQLRLTILGKITGNNTVGSNVMPQWNLPYDMKVVTRTLVVLDDVWSLSVLEQLMFRIPGCKFLVVSRVKFPQAIVKCTYELDLLREDEAVTLFCHFAFGQKSIPFGSNQKLVKQVIEECKGLPLALKVIGASLRGQPELFWASAKTRLSRGQPIGETHETQLLQRMKLSIDCLSEKVRECFLDLGSFPEDKRIPLDVLINMWAESHDVDDKEAFSILIELSDRNLLTLVKDARAGDMYSSYYEIFVSQHDVLRDLAIFLGNGENVTQRRRLIMPRREFELPKEWERNIDQPFNAQIVSVHTGEMGAMDWFPMQFPKAEVLILNFSASQYYLPPFIENMPKLRALILMNHSTSNTELLNISVIRNSTNLKSLWFEKVSIPRLPEATLISWKNLRKISLVLCKINNNLDQGVVDPTQLFPRLTELTLDHCIDLFELPSGFCNLKDLKSLSITNCHSLHELPADLGKLKSLEILRIYACPELKKLPPGLCNLVALNYLDISQCISLETLPEMMGGLISLEKIDMRECPKIRDIPSSAVLLRSLHRVICDEEISWMWNDVTKAMIPDVCIQVAEECFTLDWLVE